MSSIQTDQTEKVSGANIKEIPLRTLVILPFLLQIFVVVGIRGYWSLWYGERLIDLVGQLQLEVSDRPLAHRQVHSPHKIYSNPISIVRVGQVANLSRQDAYPVNHLEASSQSALHSQTLTKNILDLAKIEAHRLKIHPSASLLRTFWNGMIATQMQAIERAMRFQTEIFSDLSAGMSANEIILRQVWLYALGDAIKGIKWCKAAGLKVSSRHGKESNFWCEWAFFRSLTSIALLTRLSKQPFCTSPAREEVVVGRSVRLSSRQTLQDRAIYPKQQDERQVAFASKLKDSVQNFLKKAIAPPVERDLYPERSL